MLECNECPRMMRDYSLGQPDVDVEVERSQLYLFSLSSIG